ncbi:MAG: hypothetical protein DI629_17625 [Mesorhizobium amorphae]|nr:MAG: hypothetical protein DI629_17625 [Mesorhizobium amorphae]
MRPGDAPPLDRLPRGVVILPGPGEDVVLPMLKRSPLADPPPLFAQAARNRRIMWIILCVFSLLLAGAVLSVVFEFGPGRMAWYRSV